MTTEVTTSKLVAIRAATHPEGTPAYDRVVFEFEGPMPLIEVGYVKQLIADGSGMPITIEGKHILQVRFSSTNAHNTDGKPTAPTRLNTKLPVVKEIVSAGDFEEVVTYGIGITRKSDTRMITMENKHRLVIDFMV